MEVERSKMTWLIKPSLIWVLITIILSILVIYGLVCVYNFTVYRKMLSHLSKSYKQASDILYIHMKFQRVYSKSAFALFGIHTRQHKRIFRLQELSKIVGYDFFRQYQEEMSKSKGRFIHEFTLSVEDAIYEYEEEGYIQGKRIITRIYRI